MQILIDPGEMAQRLRDITAYVIVLGQWAREHQRLPESYIQDMARQLINN